MYVCMDGWMDGWMYVCMHGWMHACMHMHNFMAEMQGAKYLAHFQRMDMSY